MHIENTFAVIGKHISIQMITSVANEDKHNNSSKATCILLLYTENLVQLLFHYVHVSDLEQIEIFHRPVLEFSQHIKTPFETNSRICLCSFV